LQKQTHKIGPSPFISVDEYGEGDLVIFLHGIGGNKRNWLSNFESFSKHFKTVAWDARGYGESDDYDGELNFDDFAQDLNKVIEYFSRKKAHIVGLSMGGRIAFTFFKNFPSKVASLVLCDTHKGFKHFTEEQQNEFIRLRKEPLISGKEPSDIAPIVAKTLIGNINNSDVYEQLVDSMNRLHKLSYIKSIEASVKSDHTDILHKIDVPTLVVVGELDTLTPPDLAKEIANEIPNAKLEIISGAGHLSNIEQPDIFNNKVIKFLLNLRQTHNKT
tara:strand:+ start:3305 stop:4126 length:822 start_codon:yes stop_codon:yes gene_type:complete